ncbi:EXS family domain containing protein [Tylopilus felleus]
MLLPIILSNLPALHAQFFDMLDAELDKVEKFYAEREEEMHERDILLRRQLDELRLHRELFYHFAHFNMKAEKCHQTGGMSLDPHKYQEAKRRLREAVVEHHQCELNLAGFRKTLEKYGKITNINIPVLDAYIRQKVIPCSFASGAMVGTMLMEMEHLLATRFEHGDIRKAKCRLRVTQSPNTQHSSKFRSGLWLGLALPAIAGGSYLSLQENTRMSLPSCDIILFIYSILVIPVLLSLLIGINILVWTRKRISYAFIFGLNPRSRLHHHEYFELPSFLLCTLAYAFWFSLAQIGRPMLWPLIWLALALVVIFNPIRVSHFPHFCSLMWGRARWWTIRNMAKLGTSGIWEVGFTDAWLGDQLCSLEYSFSNLFFVGCFYTRFVKNASLYDSKVQEAWSTCSVAQNWGWYYLLGMLPYIVRFIQCLRTYRDSKVPLQLVNAGKYMMSLICYFCYYHWKHQDAPYAGKIYILWCFTATISSIYGCVWDFLMDWSVCQPHARYPLLRPRLVYKSHVPVSNLCIRFSWLTNIFLGGTNAQLFSFIAALLEMLRRVQWNFYRLENRHLNNADRYQVTRKMPLPYNF